ncbi:hypothetical protein HD806DRAFT_244899 [Xylariaceae sp. AK1471]|nr:hypothetical protein HD806DRAFT_244899 [Xylariaceae sp. AK1471]
MIPLNIHTRATKYAAVLGWIPLNRDSKTFVFCKFDKLAARNLLCTQSELLCIERENWLSSITRMHTRRSTTCRPKTPLDMGDTGQPEQS